MQQPPPPKSSDAESVDVSVEDLDVEAGTNDLLKPWLPQQLVGRYILLAPIARGGMAEIWLARQEGPHGFEKLVVVKRILTGSEKNPGFVQMFLDEARITSQLNHPNIVQVIELGDHDDSLFIAMEYVHGESLSSFVMALRQSKVETSPALVCRLISLAAEGSVMPT